MKILITGTAGFIGFHLARQRLQQGDEIIGLDNLNDYYDVGLKKARLAILQSFEKLAFYEADLCDTNTLNTIMSRHQPDCVVHLAAQAGVRYSLTHPERYVQSNLVGFANILEVCRHHHVKHLLYASSSSVYGANSKQPFNENDATNHPLSLYAASKKANELMAHAYSNLYQLPTTGLRFFTVYGPWGRPDMAFFSFTRDILAGNPITVFNGGQLQRDFTYIDDIIAGISKALEQPAAPDPNWNSHQPDAGSSYAPYRIYNIGCGAPVRVIDYIHAIEQALGKKAILVEAPAPASEAKLTHADTQRLHTTFQYHPVTHYRHGIEKFVAWYEEYQNANLSCCQY